MKNFILRDNYIKERALDYISGLPPEILFEVDVYEHTDKRTSQQNKLYWAILNELAEVSRHSSDVWHEYFKITFIGVDERVVNGKEIRYGISTTSLSTTDFADYVTRVTVFMDEYKAGLHT